MRKYSLVYKHYTNKMSQAEQDIKIINDIVRRALQEAIEKKYEPNPDGTIPLKFTNQERVRLRDVHVRMELRRIIDSKRR